MSNHKVRFFTELKLAENSIIIYYNNYVAKAPELMR